MDVTVVSLIDEKILGSVTKVEEKKKKCGEEERGISQLYLRYVKPHSFERSRVLTLNRAL